MARSRTLFDPTPLLAVLVAAFAAAPPGLTLQLSTDARGIEPGELVLVTARTSRPAETVTGSTPAGTLHFSRTADPLAWEALVGLDLAVKPGPLALAVTATAGDTTARLSLDLDVRAKTFPSRRITVDQRFVSPPASELARIEREAKLLAGVLANVSPRRLWDAPWVAPVPGPVTSAFGRVSIINNTRRTPHVGTDFRAATGTPVRAPASGTVVLSDNLYFAGEAIVIDHGLGLFSMLVHLSERRRQAGDTVAGGEVIGLSGATGRITGPHLHWTVRLGAARIDPMSVLAVLGDRTPPRSAR